MEHNYRDSFSVSDATFANDSAACGGVMLTYNSTINISSSTFTNNSATSCGGVMWTSNNSAADSGGVAFIVEASSFGVIFVSNGGSVIITNTSKWGEGGT